MSAKLRAAPRRSESRSASPVSRPISDASPPPTKHVAKPKAHVTRSRSSSGEPRHKSHGGHRRYSRSRSPYPPQDKRGGGGGGGQRYYDDYTPQSYRRGGGDYRRGGEGDSRSPPPAVQHFGNPRRGGRQFLDRERPAESKCIGVFGLSLETDERDLRSLFGRFGPIDEVRVIQDYQTGRSRGFAFIYFKYIEDAIEAKEQASGEELDGRPIRIDYSFTQRAHSPTPGTYRGRGGGGGGYGDERGRGSYSRGPPPPRRESPPIYESYREPYRAGRYPPSGGDRYNGGGGDRDYYEGGGGGSRRYAPRSRSRSPFAPPARRY